MKRYEIEYQALSHVGKCRKNNQDNLICEKKYLMKNGQDEFFSQKGRITSKDKDVLAIFDGMGGEQCGEIASYIAASTAARMTPDKDGIRILVEFIGDANSRICTYMDEHKVRSMGTTVAMLLFMEKEIDLCNIGDSKIFCFDGQSMNQISKDHVSRFGTGRKPPLTQNLGIRPRDLILDPYYANIKYHDGDTYLICSDGVTDMVDTTEIEQCMRMDNLQDAADMLLRKALDNGGTDNTSFIICRIRKISIVSSLVRANHSHLRM